MATTKASFLIACFIFGAFAAYAVGARATYVSHALIAIERETRDRTAPAVGSLEAASRLAEALGREVDVTTIDGRTFALSCRAGSAHHAQSLCNRVARRALEVAPQALAPSAADVARLSTRRAAEHLALFASTHPELLAPSDTPPAAAVVEQWEGAIRSARESRKRTSGAVVRARLVEEAQAPDRPIHPDRRLLLALGALFGLLASLVVNALPRGRSSAASRAIERTPVGDTPLPVAAEPRRTPDLPPVEPRRTPDPLAADQRVPPTAGVLGPAPVLSATGRTLVGAVVPPALRAGGGSGSTHRDYRFVAEASAVTLEEGFSGRSTAILGSFATPLPPPPDPPQPRLTSQPPRSAPSHPPLTRPQGSMTPAPISSKPILEIAGSRYSYVSTPSPPGEVERVREHPPRAFGPVASLKPEKCRDLRRELFACGVRGCFVVTVSSSAEYLAKKSEFAAELALALAEPGQARVLLLEGDPEYPSVHTLLGVSMPPDLSLTEQLESMAAGGRGPRWHVLRCTSSLSVLGETAPAAWSQARVAEFHSCLLSVRQKFDFVVISGPSTATQQVYSVAALTDGVLVVSATSDPTAARLELSPFGIKQLSRVVTIG